MGQKIENQEELQEGHTKCHYCSKQIKNELYKDHFEECEEENGPPMTVLDHYTSKSNDEFGNTEERTYRD